LQSGGPLALVVDDDIEARRAATLLLSSLGWDTVEAEDGRAGLEAVRLHNPGLVLLDVQMQVLDGLSMLRMGNPEALFTGRIVVAISGVYPQDGPMATALRAEGARGFLRKPFGAADLEEAIDFARGLSSTEPGAPIPRPPMPPASTPPRVKASAPGQTAREAIAIDRWPGAVTVVAQAVDSFGRQRVVFERVDAGGPVVRSFTRPLAEASTVRLRVVPHRSARALEGIRLLARVEHTDHDGDGGVSLLKLLAASPIDALHRLQGALEQG